MEMSDQLHDPATCPYPLDRRLSGPHSRSGRGEEEKKFIIPAWNRIPVVQPLKVKVKLSLCLIKHHAMKAYWGVEV
jgi:hypothetical protein